MSDRSTSSREPSPRPFRPHSPGSDTESISPASSWQASSNALHPSSSQHSAFSGAHLLRQPVGFGAHAAQPAHQPSSSPTPSRHYSTPAGFHGDTPHTSKTKSSKGKEKETPKEKPADPSRKGKDRDKAVPIQPAPASHGQPYPPVQPHPGAPLQRTAFRVRAYTNDPSATGTPPHVQEGPYGAAYRIGAPEETQSRSRSRNQGSRQQQHGQTHAQAMQGTASADMQPRTSYYRYDYEKIRESAPANRAKQQQAAGAAASAASPSPSSASASTPQAASHHGYTNHPPPQQQLYAHRGPSPAPNPDNRSRSSRSGKRKDTPHMYNASHGYPYPPPPPRPQPQQYYNGGTSYDFPEDTYFDPGPPPSQPPQPAPAYAYSPSPAPAPAPSKEKRHKPRSHRHGHSHDHSQSQPPPQSYYPPSAHAPPPVPQPPVRVVRVLTLLIEDKRSGEEMLTEVRVPLRPADPGDTGMWADAQEVSEELQRGPSRIDGRAKVYTMRGRYKQLFLRILDDGRHVCQPANMKVSPERTLEIFVEDNPPPAGQQPPQIPSSPPRDLLTPITDSMTSPSPAPLQMNFSGQKRPSHSSLFSADLDQEQDDFMSPSPSEHKFDVESSASSPKKRPRSSSVQSVRSVASQPAQPAGHQQYDDREGFSPLRRRSPSVMSASAGHFRTASYTSQAQASQPPSHERMHGQTSSISLESPEAATPQQGRIQSRVPSSVQPSQSSMFPQTQSHAYTSIASSTPSRSVSASSVGPSPPKRAKLDRLQVPQSQTQAQQQLTEHSVSPVPSRPGAFPFSDTRTAPVTTTTTTTGQRSVSGFEAYASKPAAAGFGGSSTTGAFGASSMASSSAFGRYDAGAFSLPTPQPSEASTTPASQTNLALPSLPLSLSTSLPTLSAPAPPPDVTTMAPSAMTMAPTLSGQASTELDNAVGKYIRGIISTEPKWSAFVQARRELLTMREQLEQYRYVRSVQTRFVGSATPADLQGAGGVTINKQQVIKAFNLKQEWGEECEEVLELVGMYGEGGTRGADGRVVGMLDEKPPVTTGMQVKKFLKVLREVHAQWTMRRGG